MEIENIRILWGLSSLSDAVRESIKRSTRLHRQGEGDLVSRVIRSTQSVKEGKLQFQDGQALLTREELISFKEERGEEEVERLLLPEVMSFLRVHVSRWGWFYPPEVSSVEEVLKKIRGLPFSQEGDISGRVYLGSDLLKSIFRSYWDVLEGPVEAFHSDVKLSRMLRYRMGLNPSGEVFDLSFSTLRKGFAVQRQVVSFFKPSAAYLIYKRWVSGSTPTVWDPACGFGARLLGFAAAFPDGIYLGNEPSSEIRRDLSSLVKKIGDGIKTVSISEKCSEDAHFEDESLDFVFTSPPYFDLEKYFNDPDQCWRKYSTEKEWEKGYLRPVMVKAIQGLKKGRFAVFNVDEARKEATLRAAKIAGFQEHACYRLLLTPDHFARKRGVTEKSEPILVFKKE